MRTLAADELSALTDSLTRLLHDHSSEAHVRATMETASGYDTALWQRLSEMGIPGLLVDERHGGTGAGPVEIERVMEVAGAQLLCAPLLAGVLAVGALTAAADDGASARLLPGIAAGTTLATLASTGPRGTWTEEAVAVRAHQHGQRWLLEGDAHYVLHGQNADVVLVVARTRSADWDDSYGLFEVAGNDVTLERVPLPTFDHTLRLANLRFADTPATLVGAANGGWVAARAAHTLGLVALAGEQAGGARRTLEFTVEYAKTRIQFGRAIGSFQAIKHMAADLLLESESATSAARAAAAALAAGAADADAAVTLAAFACADAFSAVTATAVQMHGGIAFTWEHPAHLYLRRARADAQLLGAPAYHRERYVQLLEG